MVPQRYNEVTQKMILVVCSSIKVHELEHFWTNREIRKWGGKFLDQTSQTEKMIQTKMGNPKT